MKILNFLKSQKEVSDFDLLPDGIFTLEQDGKISDVNSKVLEYYKTTRFNIVGKYFSDVIENGTAILNDIINNDTTVCAKAKLGANNTKNIFFEVNASRDNQNQRVFATVRNVTGKRNEQKTINEKYSAAQKIIDGKNDFLLVASGSVLSNLVSIIGFSRALLDGIGGALSQKQEKYLTIINSNSRDLSYDLEKLFALFQLESNKVEYKYKSFDLISLIKYLQS